MKPTQIKEEASKPDIPLQALSPSGKALSSISLDPLKKQLADTDSYDPVVCTATAAHFRKVEPATNLPLRVKLRNILSNKIARRSLQVTIWFTLFTMVYYTISLIPAFQGVAAVTRGLQLQAESNSESSQNVAYGFLQECGNRKNSNLPLGPDCIKYLSKTPKAPHDIDNWMVDPPPSNSTNSTLAATSPFGNKDEAAQSHTIQVPSNPTAGNGTPTWCIFALLVVILVTHLLLLAFIIYAKFPRKISSRCTQLVGERLEWLESCIGLKDTFYLQIFVTIGAILLFIASWIVMVIRLHKQQRWAAASEFLAACKMQKDNGLPLGDDCSRYIWKALKLAPVPAVEVTKWGILASIGCTVFIIATTPSIVARMLRSTCDQLDAFPYRASELSLRESVRAKRSMEDLDTEESEEIAKAILTRQMERILWPELSIPLSLRDYPHLPYPREIDTHEGCNDRLVESLT